MDNLGKKNDNGKPDWSLIDMQLIEPLVAVMTKGAKKYGYLNWKKKFDEPDRRFHAAMMRHAKESQHNALKWNKEDECYHLAQVAINALFRLYHALDNDASHPVHNRRQKDNIPNTGNDYYNEMMKQYKKRNP